MKGILAKLAVFAVSVVIGAVVAGVVVKAMQPRTPQSSAHEAPEYLLAGSDTPAGPGPVVAFNDEPAPAAEPLPTLSPEDLNAAATALLGGSEDPGVAAEPAAFKDPTGFPRIDPVTQFDGGPFQGANCTLASGAMLARLAFGVVTNGSILRTLQDDQSGGTDLNDLATALWRGYGVSAQKGLVRPQQLKNLLAAGYGAVIQGIYGEIPPGLRLQRTFTGGHAIYVDGYYPGNAKRGIPEAYYVIDPLGRPKGGYKGEWWPASIVDDFALAFGGSRIAAMWAFPPGGVPPEVVGPDVVPIPIKPDKDPDGTPDPDATEAPEEPGVTPVPVPSGFSPVDPGDVTAELADAPAPPVIDADDFGTIVVPVFDICLVNKQLPGCPDGIEVVFPSGEIPVLQLPPGPTVTVVFVDSDRANKAIVGFTVDPPATADVKYWVQGQSPATVQHAASMTTFDIGGTPVVLAELDVQAATNYDFQVVAGDGLMVGTSEVGSFATGSGVTVFDVAISQQASPLIKAGSGLSPYSHLAPDALLLPMVKLADLDGACELAADYGGTGYCLDQEVLGPASEACTKATVTYELAGIDSESVAVRAYPAEAGELPDGTLTLDGVLEAAGPPAAGTVSVGCLASGMTYHIAIDALGDDRGILASETVTIP